MIVPVAPMVTHAESSLQLRGQALSETALPGSGGQELTLDFGCLGDQGWGFFAGGGGAPGPGEGDGGAAGGPVQARFALRGVAPVKDPTPEPGAGRL